MTYRGKDLLHEALKGRQEDYSCAESSRWRQIKCMGCDWTGVKAQVSGALAEDRRPPFPAPILGSSHCLELRL